MTIKELYKIINSEKPKGMSLEKYMLKHPNRTHSRSTLILVARKKKQKNTHNSDGYRWRNYD